MSWEEFDAPRGIAPSATAYSNVPVATTVLRLAAGLAVAGTALGGGGALATGAPGIAVGTIAAGAITAALLMAVAFGLEILLGIYDANRAVLLAVQALTEEPDEDDPGNLEDLNH